MEIKTELFKTYEDNPYGDRHPRKRFDLRVTGDFFDFAMTGIMEESYCNYNYSKKYQDRTRVVFTTFTNNSTYNKTRKLTESERVKLIQHCVNLLSEAAVNEFENASFISWDLGGNQESYRFPIYSKANTIGIRKLRKPKRIYVNTNFKKLQTMEVITP